MELEPIVTFRGHTATITALRISTAINTVFSASLDSTVRLWRLPPHNEDQYAPFERSYALQVLEGHTEAVWDICLLPPHEVSQPGKRSIPHRRLVSASSDGSVKVWCDQNGVWRLQSSFGNFSEGALPICLSLFNLDFGKIVVGLSSGQAKLFDVDTLEEMQSFGDILEGERVLSGTQPALNTISGGQINAILSHPTLPMIVTAHEDGHLRFFDVKSRTQTSVPDDCRPT